MSLLRSKSARRYAVLAVVCSLFFLLPGTRLWATARSIGGRTVARVLGASAPAFGFGGGGAAAPAVTATKTATLQTDADIDGKADPGDTIRYSVSVGVTGADATAVHLADSPDANTTLVGGSVVISPLAIAETYASVGNMTLTSTSIGTDCTAPAHSVLCNDTMHAA